ncbi:Putative protein involved in folic acid metabolism [Blumeria hordei DH14]|uniref:Dihydroneopterin aldolase/epimerase domain-containing protein n=1 Tax=Blumeria graminis f. sp. hordei (strain DH14) TaxID=546991 RepID=N1JH25_BLUG1|nr:Putative protein involved in folic acid metabolism [Blumeria hordei DH14]
MVKLTRKWAIRQSIGEVQSVIRITNLQTSIARVCDAWGRHKNPQPVLINCSIYLGKSFHNTSASDTLTDSTVNYGILSKSILEACQEFSNSSGDNPVELSHILHYLQQWLTGIQSSDKIKSSVQRIPLLQSTELDLLELDIILPKGSLHGDRVQMSASFGYRDRKSLLTRSMTLKIFHLKTFTVIGVNDNERLARQQVIATLEIDPFDEEFKEDFCALEQLTVMTIEESSFQTLEALTDQIGRRVAEYFLCPLIQNTPEPRDLDCIWPTIKIQLSKPTAVVFADAPTVETLIDSKEYVRDSKISVQSACHKPPFPMIGRLEDWIEKIEKRAEI